METFIIYDKDTKKIIGIQQSFEIPKNKGRFKYKKADRSLFKTILKENKIFKYDDKKDEFSTEDPPEFIEEVIN